MSNRQETIWPERLLLGAMLVSLGVTLCIVISVHHRASKEVHLPAAVPAQISVVTGSVANAVSSAKRSTVKVDARPKVAADSPPPASKIALPPPEDPTKKAITSLTTAMATELAAAGEADRRAAALDKARIAAEADTKRWKRRESLVKQQIGALERQAETLEARDAQLASERDVLAQERDALKAALTNAKRQGSFAVLPYKGPNGTWRRPIVIECADSTVKLRPDGPSFSMADLSPFLNPRSNPLVLAVARQLLHSERSQTPDGGPAVPYLVFLVRPSGIRTYYEARERLEPLGIAFGYELIDQNLVVDVPDFDNVATWDGSAPVELPIVPAPDASPELSLPTARNGLARNGQRAGSGTRGADAGRSSGSVGDIAMGPAPGSVADFVWPSGSRGTGNGKINLPQSNVGSPNRSGMTGAAGGAVEASDAGKRTAATDGNTAPGAASQGGSALSRSTSSWLAATPPGAGQGTRPSDESFGSGSGSNSDMQEKATGGLLGSKANRSRLPGGSGAPGGNGSASKPRTGGTGSATGDSTANSSDNQAGSAGTNSGSQTKVTQPGSPTSGPGELPDLEPAGTSADPSTIPFNPPGIGSRAPGASRDNSVGSPPTASRRSAEFTANAGPANTLSQPLGSATAGGGRPLTGAPDNTASAPSGAQPNQGNSEDMTGGNLAPPAEEATNKLTPLGSTASAPANTPTGPASGSTAGNPTPPTTAGAASPSAADLDPALIAFKPTAAQPESTSASSEDLPFRSTPPPSTSPPSSSLGSFFASTTSDNTSSGSPSPASSSLSSSNSSSTQTSGSSADPSPPAGIGLPSFSLNQPEDSSDTKSPFNIAPPPIVPRPTGAIDVQFQIVVVCRQNDILLHPGGYTLSSQALKEQGGGPDSLLARELRAVLRRRANIDPMIRPKPSIKYLVETNGSDTFWTARKLLMFSGLDWPTSLEVAGAQERSILTGDAR